MVAIKIRIAKPTLGVQLKKAVDLPGLTETPVKLGRKGAAEATPATSAKAGVASSHGGAEGRASTHGATAGAKRKPRRSGASSRDVRFPAN